MRPLRYWIFGITFGVMLLAPPIWGDVTLGQIDTFSGSTQGWTNGAPATDPVVIPNGGPGGAGDGFLQETATGSGPGGKLTVFNRSQWIGNYVAAGVDEIDMDLKNLGSTQLSMRVALKSGTGFASPGYLTTLPFLLAADGSWHHASFFLDSADLTGIFGPAPLNSFLTSVAELRIINEAAAINLTGDNVVSQLGVDNIAALAAPTTVPEPSAFLFLASCVGLLYWRKRTRPVH